MKKFAVAFTLVMIAAAPAYAATHHTTKRSDDPKAAYASAATSPQVAFDGKVIGADPDANVRLSLRRDPELQSN